jgi:hypothetical protein
MLKILLFNFFRHHVNDLLIAFFEQSSDEENDLPLDRKDALVDAFVLSFGKLREGFDDLENIEEISIAEIDLVFDCRVLANFNEEVKDIE